MFGNSVQVLVFEDRDFGGGGSGRWRGRWGDRGGAGGSGAAGGQEKVFRAFQLLLLLLLLPLGQSLLL